MQGVQLLQGFPCSAVFSPSTKNNLANVGLMTLLQDHRFFCHPMQRFLSSEACFGQIQQQARAFKITTYMKTHAERPRETGHSISPSFIRYQEILMEDKHFEYSQPCEISPAVGTKESNPKTWLCRKEVFCCLQTGIFFLIVFFVLTQRGHG